MKKINYLVLMAAMLLVGTNAWATTHEVATDAQFETAWKTASSGDVIKLTDAITLTKTMWLGTQNMNDASRKIEIDLNGYNLLSSVQYPFLLTHGTLKISNTRPESGQVQVIMAHGEAGKEEPVDYMVIAADVEGGKISTVDTSKSGVVQDLKTVFGDVEVTK